MPTIAEFMTIYKERERVFINKQNLQISEEFPRTTDKEYNRKKIKEIVNTLMKGERPISRGLCDMPHEFSENGLKGRLTRDAYGKDYCYYYDHPINNK